MKTKALPILSASLWILGVILTIVGLNLNPPAGTWLSIIGSILFLLGLALEGIVWFRKKREKEETDRQQDGNT